MSITAVEMRVMARAGISFIARASRGPEGWSCVVCRDSSWRVDMLGDVIHTRDGAPRYWVTLDALARFCSMHHVNNLDIEIDQSHLHSVDPDDQA